MKRKIVIPVGLLLVLIAVVVAFYFAPKTFGENVNLSDIDHINVFDGNTGVNFIIDDSEQIQYIVKNIQSHQMNRDGISLGTMGYGFKITFVDEDDEIIASEIILNSDDTIRKDPFFYRCEGGLCFDYLKKIEAEAK